MIQPRPVGAGSTVRLIAPSGCLHVEDREKAVRECVEHFAALGFVVQTDPTCFMQEGYLAGGDEARAEALMRAFADDEVEGVFCLKGGWGVNRMLPYVDFSVVRAHPKAFLGYSDITSLHLALCRHASLCTFHGPMGTSRCWNEEVTSSLMAALGGHPQKPFQPEKLTCLRPGQARGELIGGNLSLLAAACGTPYDAAFDGKILFIEEIAEQTYAVDRYLCHLLLAGKLDRLAGLVFGAFTDVSNEYPQSGFSLEEVLEHYAGRVSCPVACALSAGHINRNLTLPFGREYVLDADQGTFFPA